jgi:hypothetical protein
VALEQERSRGVSEGRLHETSWRGAGFWVFDSRKQKVGVIYPPECPPTAVVPWWMTGPLREMAFAQVWMLFLREQQGVEVLAEKMLAWRRILQPAVSAALLVFAVAASVCLGDGRFAWLERLLSLRDTFIG